MERARHVRPPVTSTWSAFGDLRLDQVGLAEIEAHKADELTAGPAKKTINNHLTVLRKLLSTAVVWRRLSLVPPIKWLKAPAAEFDFLTFEEADRRGWPEIPCCKTRAVGHDLEELPHSTIS